MNRTPSDLTDGPSAVPDAQRLVEISVVAPCLNEEGNISELVRRVYEVFHSKNLCGEIILVDDGSTDGTVEKVTSLMTDYPMLRLERHARNLGIEAGWRTGVHAARGKFVCLIDADLQNPPEQIWRLYQEIMFSRADMVQGARSSIGRLRDSRFLLSRGLNLILNVTFDMDLRDNKSGFVIAQKDVLLDVLRHRFNYYYFQSFIAVSAKSKGYSIRQVETLFESRYAGKSFISGLPTKFIYRTLVDVLKGFFEFRLSIKRDNILADFLQSHHPVTIERPLPAWRRLLLHLYFACAPIHSPHLSRQAKLYYEELKRSQWLRSDDLKKLQEAKLRALIQHSYQHVPYYREQLSKRNLSPDDVKTIDDLSKLPTLSRDIVQQNLYFNLLSDNHDKRRILRISSASASGEPFTLFADRHQLEIGWASMIRCMEWVGYKFGDRQATIIDSATKTTTWGKLQRRLEALLSRRLTLSAFRKSTEELREMAVQIAQYKPVFFQGSSESLHLLTSSLASNESETVGPKAIISDGQVLPQNDREAMQQKLSSRVFDKWTCPEFFGIAHECEAHQGHHVMAESYIVELLNGDAPVQPGEVGEIVVTDLNNYCMPLIRYRTGERAIAIAANHRCSCGRGLPMIGNLQPRTFKSPIVDQDNRCIHENFFLQFFGNYGYLVKHCEVQQVVPGTIKLTLVRGTRFTSSELRNALALLRSSLGNDFKIEIDLLEELPLVRSDAAREAFPSATSSMKLKEVDSHIL